MDSFLWLRKNAVRVILIEPHILFAKALSQSLTSDDLTIVGTAQSIADIQLREFRPDVVMIDVDGHAVNIVESLGEVRDQTPLARACLLSGSFPPEFMQRCVSAGAHGYVIKDMLPADLRGVLKLVAAGGSYMDPRLAGGLLRRRVALHGRADVDVLSPREEDIIRLIAEGLSNKDISSRLALSEAIVKNHISRIFSKLNISGRTQAAIHATRTGIV